MTPDRNLAAAAVRSWIKGRSTFARLPSTSGRLRCERAAALHEQGMKTRHIAAEMDCTPAAARGLVRYARQRAARNGGVTRA